MAVVQVEEGFFVKGEAEASVDSCGIFEFGAFSDGLEAWGGVGCGFGPGGEVEFWGVLGGGVLVVGLCWRWVVVDVVQRIISAWDVMGWRLICIFILVCVAVAVAQVCDRIISIGIGHDALRTRA